MTKRCKHTRNNTTLFKLREIGTYAILGFPNQHENPRPLWDRSQWSVTVRCGDCNGRFHFTSNRYPLWVGRIVAKMAPELFEPKERDDAGDVAT